MLQHVTGRDSSSCCNMLHIKIIIDEKLMSSDVCLVFSIRWQHHTDCWQLCFQIQVENLKFLENQARTVTITNTGQVSSRWVEWLTSGLRSLMSRVQWDVPFNLSVYSPFWMTSHQDSSVVVSFVRLMQKTVVLLFHLCSWCSWPLGSCGHFRSFCCMICFGIAKSQDQLPP